MRMSADQDGGWKRTSWLIPRIHRGSRKALSDLGYAAQRSPNRHVTYGGTEWHNNRDKISSRCQSLPADIGDDDLSSGVSVVPAGEPFSLLRMSRNETLTLLGLAVVDLFMYLCMSIMAPFFPAKVEEVGASETISGLVFAVYALSVTLFSPVFAKLVPITGAKFTFIAGVFVAGGCNVLFGLLDYVNEPDIFTALAFTIRVVEGAGAAAFSTASFTILAYVFAGNVPIVFGILEAFVGLGMTLGPAIGGFLYSAGGFKVPFFVVGSLMLLTVPLNMWLLPFHRHVVAKPTMGSQAKFFRNPSVYMVCLTITVIGSVWGFLDPTLQPHLLQFDLKPAIIGLLFLLLSLTYTIFSPIWGWVAKRLDNSDVMMVLGLIFSAAALLFLGPAPGLLPLVGSLLWLNILSLAVLGAAVALTLIPSFGSLLFASEQAGMEDSIETYALVSGAWGTAYSLGEVVGPAIGGFLDDHYQFSACSAMVAVVCLVTAFLFGTFIMVRTLMVRLKAKKATAEVNEVTQRRYPSSRSPIVPRIAKSHSAWTDSPNEKSMLKSDRSRGQRDYGTVPT